jgi:hypothetical protein
LRSLRRNGGSSWNRGSCKNFEKKACKGQGFMRA